MAWEYVLLKVRAIVIVGVLIFTFGSNTITFAQIDYYQ